MSLYKMGFKLGGYLRNRSLFPGGSVAKIVYRAKNEWEALQKNKVSVVSRKDTLKRIALFRL